MSARTAGEEEGSTQIIGQIDAIYAVNYADRPESFASQSASYS
jgi:hypothetical protein